MPRHLDHASAAFIVVPMDAPEILSARLVGPDAIDALCRGTRRARELVKGRQRDIQLSQPLHGRKPLLAINDLRLEAHHTLARHLAVIEAEPSDLVHHRSCYL